MKKGRLLVWFMLFGIVLALAACGGNDKESKENDSPNKDKKMTLRVAGTYPPEHPTTKNLEQLKQEIEEKTDGQIELKLYPANQLGDYTLVYEELMRGTIDMGLITVPTQFDSNLNINYVNYIAESYDAAKEMFSPSSYIFGVNEKIHDKLGVKFLGFHFEGMTGVGSVKEIKDYAEFGKDKDIMLRVPSLEVLRSSMESLGFRTVSVDYSELYHALQTGVADAWAGGSPVPNYHDVGDVIKYYYAYNNWFETTQLLINKDLWTGISEENVKIIENATENFYARSLDISQENDELYKKKLSEDHGVKIVEFTEEEMAHLKENVQQITWPKLDKVLDKEIYDGLMESTKN